MKLKTLLFLFLLSYGALHAQDTIRSLIISEAVLRTPQWGYIELTNMGDEDVQLADFTLGRIDPWDSQVSESGENWVPRHPTHSFRLPERILEPGESYLIANVWDYSLELHAKGIDTPGSGSAEVLHKKDLEELADLQIHMEESDGAATDSVSPYKDVLVSWNGRDTWYVQYHFPNGDSLVVDQVNGVFDDDDGLNQKFSDTYDGYFGYDVAGVRGASFEAHLIRKFKVKQGNLDFNGARGVHGEDSEWIAIPIEDDNNKYDTNFRKALWTAGNHVNAQLDENTLESDVIEVDLANKTLTVPWGVRRNDDIMNYFVRKPGIGWNYLRARGTSAEDSLSFAAKTGDQLELWVCGDDVDKAIFEIIVEEPAANANIVVPKLNQDPQGSWRNQLARGMIDWPRVTQHESGTDSIWGVWGGIPYQTRIDTLLNRLEIPSNATWELITVDGIERPDLKQGDILKIIAQDGSEKEYYISVNAILLSRNAHLSSITWPDIPDFYQGIFGWVGDTIPNFNKGSYNYTVTVPLDVEGIPALVAKTEDLNATVDVKRATSLSGTKENRTITFTVTAEDDTTVNIYTVELVKEKNPADVQPFAADPFVSEFIMKKQWANSYIEIVNPGNQLMDLSNYMFLSAFEETPVDELLSTNFSTRYRKYVPGYKFTDVEGIWVVDPGMLERDLSVNTNVQPGDVFVMADINSPKDHTPWDQIDIDFKTNWGDIGSGGQNGLVGQWQNAHFFVFKILNDSIKRGLKPMNDINDFELIEAKHFARPNYANVTSIRLPEIWHGNPVLGDSQSEENFEWTVLNRQTDLGGSWAAVIANIGLHYFIPPTHYMSTVSSVVYKVSEGYSLNEQIKGITTGTTVSNLLANLIKANEGQSLTVTSNTDGTELAMDELLSLNDILTVLSADSTNTTKYVLEVSEDGLSSDAVLTSDLYDIEFDAETKSANDEHTAGSGIISGFDYGTTVRTIANNVTVPEGASMSIINADGAYVPLRKLNYDTINVSVTVSSEIFFDVLAEDRVTRIVYQLQPNFSESDAFVTSDMYSVKQGDFLIELVPRGTNVQSFLSNLIPVFGASLEIVDKWGNIRTDGIVADDDKLLVTSADETVTNVYHISKLATQYVPVTTYLAYILSDVYDVDQVGYAIAGATTTTQLSDFYARIRPVIGATAVVIDAEGNEKNTSGDLARGDILKVTSADGKIEVMYELQLTVVSAKLPETAQIEIYPNPTTGKLNISGLQQGSRVQISNAMGVMMQDINVKQSIETVSLEHYSPGVYFVITSKNNLITGKHKIVKF